DAMRRQLADNVGPTAVIDGCNQIDAASLVAAAQAWIGDLQRRRVKAGDVCAFVGEFSEKSIALLLALMSMRAIAMPLTLSALPELERLLAIAGTQWLIRLETASPSITAVDKFSQNHLVDQFRQIHHAGLVVFTSGSSGEPQGIFHDFERVLGKFARKPPRL